MKKIDKLIRKKSAEILSIMCVAIIIVSLTPDVIFMKINSSAAWDGSIALSFAGGDGSQSDPYLISTPQQLAYLAQQTNAGNDFSGKYFKQTENINLGDGTSIQWIPIGTQDKAPFRGIYNGNNCEMSNIYINSSEYKHSGLFGLIEDGGVVRDLCLSSGLIKSTHSSSSNSTFSGGIAGRNNGFVINCTYAGSVTSSNTSDYDVESGGIAGFNDGFIIGCQNTGTILASSASSYANAGGIAGASYAGVIVGCSNKGSITTSTASYSDAESGGIAGYNKNKSDIIGSYNVETVSSTCQKSSANPYKGGITGFSDNSGNINSCYWLQNKGAAYVIGNETSTTGKITDDQFKNTDLKNTIVDAMNDALKAYYDNSVITDHYYWSYDGSTDGYPVITKLTPTIDDLVIEGIPEDGIKFYDSIPVIVTATAKPEAVGLGTLGEIKYNDDVTAPNAPGTYKVTVDICEGDNYCAGTVNLGEFTIRKAKVTAGDINPEHLDDFIYSLRLKTKTPEANDYGYYSWENPEALADKLGKNDYKLIFTPNDTDNYDYTSIDGWDWDSASKTLSKTFTVNTVFLKNRQIIIYFNRNVNK